MYQSNGSGTGREETPYREHSSVPEPIDNDNQDSEPTSDITDGECKRSGAFLCGSDKSACFWLKKCALEDHLIAKIDRPGLIPYAFKLMSILERRAAKDDIDLQQISLVYAVVDRVLMDRSLPFSREHRGPIALQMLRRAANQMDPRTWEGDAQLWKSKPGDRALEFVNILPKTEIRRAPVSGHS